MGDPKPIASLSSSLLARKGQARPAMRPQGFAGFTHPMGNSHDDLGWNDMGLEMQRPYGLQEEDHANSFSAHEVPAVIREREELAEEIAAMPRNLALPENVAEVQAVTAAADPVISRPLPTVAIARAKKAAKGRTTKAAFTLRLDPERHLKLRLACAVSRESAQAIVTEALDLYLGSLPEIEALVRKVPANG